MSLVTKLKVATKLVINKDFRFDYLPEHGRYHDMPDEEYLRRKWKARMGGIKFR